MSNSSVQNDRIKILKLFKKEATEFLDELIEQFEQEGSLVVAKIFIETQLPVEELIQSFGSKILPHKAMIDARNESFFLNHDVSFFGNVEKSEVVKFKTMWIQLDPDAKLAVWQWFDLFVKLAARYFELNTKSE